MLRFIEFSSIFAMRSYVQREYLKIGGTVWSYTTKTIFFPLMFLTRLLWFTLNTQCFIMWRRLDYSIERVW